MPDEGEVLYLLNTDPDCAALIRVWLDGQLSDEITVPAAEMIVAYRFDDILLAASDKCLEVQDFHGDAQQVTVSLFSVRDQALTVHNLGEQVKTITINGSSVTVSPETSAEVMLQRREQDGNPGYAEDFLEELPLDVEINPRTPY
jgi:hypothetical protein